MSRTLHVATRKGLFTFERESSAGPSSWKIVDVSFLGNPVTMTLLDRRDGTFYAALDLGHFGVKLHCRIEDDSAWQECAVPVYPKGETIGQFPSEEGAPEIPPKPASLSYIWSLETGGDDQPDLLWCGTIPGGLFVSKNRGAEWELVRSLWDLSERQMWFGGGMDNPGIHSICVDLRNSKHVSLAISCGGVWTSKDAGESWACQADGMFADYLPPPTKPKTRTCKTHIVWCNAQPTPMFCGSNTITAFFARSILRTLGRKLKMYRHPISALPLPFILTTHKRPGSFQV